MTDCGDNQTLPNFVLVTNVHSMYMFAAATGSGNEVSCSQLRDLINIENFQFITFHDFHEIPRRLSTDSKLQVVYNISNKSGYTFAQHRIFKTYCKRSSRVRTCGESPIQIQQHRITKKLGLSCLKWSCVVSSPTNVQQSQSREMNIPGFRVQGWYLRK